MICCFILLGATFFPVQFKIKVPYMTVECIVIQGESNFRNVTCILSICTMENALKISTNMPMFGLVVLETVVFR